MPEALLQLRKLMAAGRYAEAVDVVSNRKNGSWSAQGLHLAALLFERLLRPADAIDVWLEFNDLYPADPRAATGLARNLRRIGDEAAALRLLRAWRDRLCRERRNRILLDAGAELVQLKKPHEAALYLAAPAMHDRMAADALKVMAHCSVLTGQRTVAAALLAAYDTMYRPPQPPGASIVSYPKAGITWLSFLLSQAIITHFKLPRARPTIFFNALLQEAGLDLHVSRSHDEAGVRTENGDDCNVDALFLYDARECYRGAKVLLLIRDPRDVVVSFYHQLTQRTLGSSFSMTLPEFVRDPVLGFRRLVRFHAIWARTLPILRESLVLRYEDLVDQTAAHLSGVLRFLSIAGVDGAAIEAAVEAGRAENMRKLERGGLVDGMMVMSEAPDGLKVRKAKSGSALEELPPSDINFLNEAMREACETDSALRALWQSYLN